MDEIKALAKKKAQEEWKKIREMAQARPAGQPPQEYPQVFGNVTKLGFMLIYAEAYEQGCVERDRQENRAMDAKKEHVTFINWASSGKQMDCLMAWK